MDLSLESAFVAFPFPEFQWTRNGMAQAVNISDTVAYGYPSVTFLNVTRSDAGIHYLFAENFVAETGQIIGNETGSFSLNILC